MPLHEWRCEKCKKEVEVVRSFENYDKPPGEEDEKSCDCPEGETPQWKKFLSKPPQGAYGGGWGPGKGNWVAIFAVAASLLLGGCTLEQKLQKATEEKRSPVSRFENEEVVCYFYASYKVGAALQCKWKEQNETTNQ